MSLDLHLLGENGLCRHLKESLTYRNLHKACATWYQMGKSDMWNTTYCSVLNNCWKKRLTHEQEHVLLKYLSTYEIKSVYMCCSDVCNHISSIMRTTDCIKKLISHWNINQRFVEFCLWTWTCHHCFKDHKWPYLYKKELKRINIATNNCVAASRQLAADFASIQVAEV